MSSPLRPTNPGDDHILNGEPAPFLVKPDPRDEPAQVMPSTIQAANSWANMLARITPQAGLI
ncbi:hypothetical protein AU374_01432 [Cupriavidus metallidurans]|nr:hypothetical protein AU374_01432 [Cupriavidus metallidurans]